MFYRPAGLFKETLPADHTSDFQGSPGTPKSHPHVLSSNQFIRPGWLWNVGGDLRTTQTEQRHAPRTLGRITPPAFHDPSRSRATQPEGSLQIS